MPTTSSSVIKPFLKWAGGKRQLWPQIQERFPDDIRKRIYCEPFLGGGGILFCLQPAKAIINDTNAELMNCYRMVKECPEELIRELGMYENTSEFFYHIRGLDRNPGLDQLVPIQRAARIIYLNKTCFNGLYRVNADGYFNVPFGKYKNPSIINADGIKAISQYLNTADVRICQGDYSQILAELDKNAFVYLDPPYHQLTGQSFTGYVRGGWNDNDQIRLRDACQSLDQKRIPFLLSNSSTDFIHQIYKEFHIQTIQAARCINSKGDRRGVVNEVLICNYVQYHSPV